MNVFSLIILDEDLIVIDKVISVLFYLSSKLRHASKDVLNDILLRTITNHLAEW